MLLQNPKASATEIRAAPTGRKVPWLQFGAWVRQRQKRALLDDADDDDDSEVTMRDNDSFFG
jgi:hypothetical protein